MSILNTRIKRCAQVIDAWCLAGVCAFPTLMALGVLPFPRFAGITTARCLLFGANTP